jgi:membrane complex biogenesis BtpA family protein
MTTRPVVNPADEPLSADFWDRKPLIGMVHLLPLPGSPRWETGASSMAVVLETAVRDARALVEGGADAMLVENFFDAPFAKDDVPPHTIAALTRAVSAVCEVAGKNVPVGVNVLRNDSRAAIAVSHVCGARFVRINVYVGAAVTDQGIIEGAARAAVLYRKELGAANVALFADVFVKHAAQLGDGSVTLEDAAKDAVYRGLADALIVSGTATGAATSPDTVRRVRAAVPDTPVLVGSGFAADTAATLLTAGADGAIVGTSIKRDGRVAAPVEPGRVRALRAAMG